MLASSRCFCPVTEQRKHPRKPPRSLSKEELAIWQQIANEVSPIKKKARREEVVPKPLKITRKAVIPEEEPRGLPPFRRHSGAKPKNALDANMLARIRDGKQRPEARIDLHGMTEDQAYIHLKSAIALAHENSLRIVVVITGKGRGGEGLLRRRVPYWLEDECAAWITAYQPALQKDGGDGALYVTLRRK